MSKPQCSIPDALPIRDVIGISDAFLDLQRRLQESVVRLQIARSVLPAALAHELRSGALDEKGWTLLVPSSAVAAKLRQWMPLIEAAINQRGLQGSSIRIRVQSEPMLNM